MLNNEPIAARIFVIAWVAIQVALASVGLVIAHVEDRQVSYAWQMWTRPPADE
jgi:hypothetical protein